MADLKEQFYKAPNRIQDGVLFLILEAAIYLTFSLFDIYENKTVWEFSAELSFIFELVIIFAITLCGLGVLYGMKAGWIGSMILAILMTVIGLILMFHVVQSSLTLSGLFYFIFGVISIAELVRKDFRTFCGITKEC